MAKIGKVMWLSTLRGSIGLVAYTNDEGEKSVRVCEVIGRHEEIDIQVVIGYGAKLKKEDVDAFSFFFNNNEDALDDAIEKLMKENGVTENIAIPEVSTEPEEHHTICLVCNKVFIDNESLVAHYDNNHR